MSAFVSPECGHHSEYDEWADSARCPNCGFEPPAGDVKSLIHQQNEPIVESTEQTDSSGLTSFLPASGRAFISGLAWGIFAFALIMLIFSRLELSESAARCIGITILLLVTFSFWRFFSGREKPD